MNRGSDVNLVERAKQLAPAFAATSAEDARLRRLSDDTWKLLLDNGFVRALQPARWGGGEVPMIDFIDAGFEISRASPSAGWVAGVIGVHPWQLALFDDRAQRDMWGDDPATMHSSSYNPTGKAEAVEGGYRVSGRWSFSSGCDHCRGVNLGANVGKIEIDGKPLPDFRSFLLFPDQYRIDDNWHVAGLRGTGSKDIVVENAFVPAHRTQSHLDYAFNQPLAGREQNDGVLYRMPWSVVFNMALATVGGRLGARLHRHVDRPEPDASPRPDACRRRRAARSDALPKRRGTSTRRGHGCAPTPSNSPRWRKARETVTMAQRAQMRWNMNRGCDLVGDAIVDLMRSASGRSIFLDHPLQHRFQDVQGALGHAFLVPDPLARHVGGALLGIDNLEMVL